MLSPTVVVPPAEFEAGDLRLEGDPYHHLFRVRRLSAGDELRLVDGEGRARWGQVREVTRRHAVVELGERAPANEPRHRVELLVGVLRRERASWLVEKATELGVVAVRFVASERSPRRFGGATFDRLERVARGAVEQCGRSRLPKVTGVHPWADLETLVEAAGDVWLADPAAPPGLGRAAKASALLVGPEGGWSADERDQLVDVGCRPVGLGQRVLRVETAAIAGLARLLVG